MRNPITIFLFILILVSGCAGSHTPVDKNDLVKYVTDRANGLKREHLVNGIKVEVTNKPASLLVQQELEAKEDHDSVDTQTLEKKYASQYYFTIKISKDNKEVIRQLGAFNRYSDMLQVLAFDVAEHVSLTTTTDTVPVADYMFDQTYGMSNANTVLVSFSKNMISKNKNIHINISECGFGIGNISFDFNADDLDRVPRLDYRKPNDLHNF